MDEGESLEEAFNRHAVELAKSYNRDRTGDICGFGLFGLIIGIAFGIKIGFFLATR